MALPAPTGRARAAAAATALLGLLHLVILPEVTHVASYLGVVTGSVALAALVGAQRLWSGGHLEGRLTAAVVALFALAAQTLNLVTGLPGATVLQDRMVVETVAGALLEVLILALLTIDWLEAAGTDPKDLYPVGHGNHGPDRRGR